MMRVAQRLGHEADSVADLPLPEPLYAEAVAVDEQRLVALMASLCKKLENCRSPAATLPSK